MKQHGFILPSPTMIMAAVIIGLSISNVLFFNLYRSTANEFATFQADVSAAQDALRLDNERKLSAVAEVNRQLDADYAAAVKRLAAGTRIVRVQPSRCEGALRPIPAATSGIDAAAEARTISAEQCEAFLQSGIEDAAKLMWIQSWIVKTHEASK